MRRHLIRHTLGIAVALLLLGHAARFHRIGFIDQIDAIIYDAKVRLTMPQGVDQRIAIIDIDEKSLKEIGHWPWGRERVAQLVRKLFDQYGIALLGVDIVFAEPDDSSGLKVLERLAEVELRDDARFLSLLEQLRPGLDHDHQFAEAIRNGPVVLGFYLSSKSEGTSTGALPAPVLPASTFADRNIAFTTWSHHGGNLPEFQQAAAGGGHFNPLVDFDGMSRRVPMLAEYQGNFYEALSLAMVRGLLGNPGVVPGFPDNKPTHKSYTAMEWIDLPTAKGVVRIPVDENAASLIPYRGYQGSFPYYSAVDILQDRVDPASLKGRVALLGTTAPGLLDLRATPVGSTYPGVEIHANLIAGMMDGTIKHKPQYVLGAEVVFLALAALVMVFLLPMLSPLRASLVTLAVLATLVLINLGFWHYANLVLPLATALLLVFGLFALNMSFGYFIESRAKRRFTELFGQYVPPELVEEMSRDPESYSMEGRNAELTVLFADIRGFTSISESLEPKQLTHLMNEYLDAMTAVIRRQRGTLDKYVGDAIMAFWGAPVDDAEHAWHAVVAALEMQAALVDLNRSLLQRGRPALRIGIGINTGMMIVGDMGSTVRKAYTVMGDAVNLASRLESISKHYEVGVVVGEATRHAVKGVVFRELDRVRVKGKEEPVATFEPLCVESELDRKAGEDLRLWNQALCHYRAQEWDRAGAALLDLTRMAPACRLYALYLERIAALRKSPPGPGWDGVTNFESK